MTRHQLEIIEPQALDALRENWCRQSSPLADPDALYVLQSMNNNTFENALCMIETLLGHLEVTDDRAAKEATQSYMDMDEIAQQVEQLAIAQRKKRPAPLFVPLVDKPSASRGMRRH